MTWVVRVKGGLDSNPGTEAEPFASVYRAIDAMAKSPDKSAYIGAGLFHEPKPWALTSGMNLLAHPADPPFSMTINNGGIGHSGAINQSGIVLKGLRFAAGSGLEFDDCQFSTLSCFWAPTPYRPNLQVYGPRAGSRVQGTRFAGATWAEEGGVFPLNIVWNDGKDYDDFIVGSNIILGGTFAGQFQYQGSPGIWTNHHFDHNICRGWGSSKSTIGNEGFSMVGSGNPLNHNNTCSFNRLTQSADRGTVWAQGVEASTAGMTHQGNVIDAQGGYAIGKGPGALFTGNTITVPGKWAAFSNDGGYVPDSVEIRANWVNKVLAYGPKDPNQQCQLNPLPTTTKLPIYAPSARYVPQ